MGNKKPTFDIIKSSDTIKKHLISKFTELNITNKEICEDANKLGFTITEAQLSNYIKKKYAPGTGGISQNQIIWLAIRYDIGLRILVGHYDKVHFDYKRILHKPFDNELALKNLKEYGY